MLRILDYFDESLLFDESAVYFTMKQLLQREKKMSCLEMDCRPFRNHHENETFRAKSNWSYFLLSDKAAYFEMEKQGKVILTLSSELHFFECLIEVYPFHMMQKLTGNFDH